MHKRWPDHVKRKKTATDDRYRLRKYVYPIAGDVALANFDLDLAERVMMELPANLPGTRRHVSQLMHRILEMAVFPARVLDANPLPRGFQPNAKGSKALTYLYPDEDRALLGCADVALPWRVFYGFLAREGMRRGEAEALTWGDLDLDRGAVKLDENKTSEPRVWSLDPGVTPALAAWYRHCGNPAAGSPVFVNAAGKALPVRTAAARLRADLNTAGVDRAELYARSDSRQPIRVHDLRATFITIALANGRSEAWIADRTGHTTSAMINRYRRNARTFAELGAGDLAPMVAAIPELAADLPFEMVDEVVDPVGADGDRRRRASRNPRKNLGSRGRTRTGTPSRIPDFESGASANSATRPERSVL